MPNNRYSWLADEEFSLHSVLGGARGVAEAVLPGLVFLGAYLMSGALVYSALASALCSVIFTVIRIAQRQAVVQAISGLFGVAIAVVWALVSGRGIHFFTWGLLTNAASALVLLLSLAVGWPLVAVIFGALTGRPLNWMRQSEMREPARKCVWLTLAWTALFIIRLAVQVPLWLSDQVAWLSAMKIALGIPLFIPVAWLTWWLLKDDFNRMASSPSE